MLFRGMTPSKNRRKGKYRRANNTHSVVTELCAKNTDLVYHIAKKYIGNRIDLEELAAEGMVGLVLAAKRFDTKQTTCGFATFAGWYITQKIYRYVLNHAGQPYTATGRKRFKDGDRHYPASLDYSLERGTVYDVVADTSAEVPGDRLTDDSQLCAWINLAQKILTSSEYLVISRRYFGDENVTLKACGDVLGVSRERARQLEARALRKLQLVAKRNGL